MDTESIKKRKVLIVDDEDFVCETMQLHFEHKGFLTLVANSADDAAFIIKEGRLSLMLLDKRMPGLGGIDFLRKVRDFDSELKVIMISSDELDSQTEMALKELNVVDYITKPCIINKLDEIVEKVLNKS